MAAWQLIDGDSWCALKQYYLERLDVIYEITQFVNQAMKMITEFVNLGYIVRQ